MSNLHHISIYDPETGEFTGRIIGASKGSYLGAMIPQGLAGVRGRFNRHTHRVDLDNGEVVARTPAPPDDDHEWSPELQQFVLRPEIAARHAADRRKTARIAEMEAAQARPMRELYLDPSNETAKAKLAEIDAQIVGLR